VTDHLHDGSGIDCPECAERQLNLAATFLPAVTDPEAMTLPAVEIAGILVFAYVKDGVLRVSVDLDTAGESDFWCDPETAVPMQLTVQGHTVYEADDRGMVTADHNGLVL
jgi:hypothetical protein